MDLLTDEPAGLLLADRRFAIQEEIASRTLSAAEGRIDVLWLGEDLGTQRTPMVSMDVFRKHFRPRYQRLVDLGKKYGCLVMIHTCGSSSWAYDEFVDMGMDAVDTLQPEAVDMSPAYLKQRFGGQTGLPRLHQHGRTGGLRDGGRRDGRLPHDPRHHDARRRVLLRPDPRSCRTTRPRRTCSPCTARRGSTGSTEYSQHELGPKGVDEY